MAAIFDLHVLIALQNGWRRFSGRASPSVDQDTHGMLNFTRHFPLVETPVVQSWFDGLVKDKNVTFRSYASPGHDDFPLVVVQLAGENRHTDMLGNAARAWEDGVSSQYVDAMTVTQEVEITIMTQAHELSRALFVCTRAILLRYTNMFLKAGYLDVSYINAQELEPEEKLIAEDAGVYVRKMRWRAMSQVEAFPIEDGLTIPGKKWWVLREDIKTTENESPPPDRVINSGGVAGGVSEI